MLSFLAVILLVPYFGWGIHALRMKYRFHVELSLVTEACTLLALVLFYALEMRLLRDAFESASIQYVVAMLGLITSGAALYGHMAISFFSRLIVEAVVPGPSANDHRPRLGPAEALEKQKDYQGALQEYYVIARMFPRDSLVPMRIANLYIQLGQPAEAVDWLRRAQKHASGEKQALSVTNRRIELFETHLKQVEDARAVIREFLEAYPDSNDGAVLRARLAVMGAPRKGPSDSSLNALSEAPLAESEAPPPPRAAKPKAAAAAAAPITLTALEDAPVMAEGFERHAVAPRAPEAPAAGFQLDKMDDVAPIEVPEAPANNPGIDLDPMDPDA
jgi:tetratricopeptide (TPR) repeat protein